MWTKSYKVLRALLVVTLALIVSVPVALYITLSLPWAQDRLKDLVVKELSERTATRVELERLDIAPFNRLRIKDLIIADDNDSTALSAGSISARFELWHFLRTGNISIDYVSLDNVQMHLYKDTAKAPFNIDPIIKRLSSKDERKEQPKINLAINTVLLNNGSLRYDVYDKPFTPGRFNPAHIRLTNLQLAAQLPYITGDNISLELDHLSAREISGLRLCNLTLEATFKNDVLSIKDLNISLPNSNLRFSDISLDTKQFSKTQQEVSDSESIQIGILSDSYVCPADLTAFEPKLSVLGKRLYLSGYFEYSPQHLTVKDLSVEDRAAGLNLHLSGQAQNPANPDMLAVKNLDLRFKSRPGALSWLPDMLPADKAPEIRRILGALGALKFDITGRGSKDATEGQLALSTDAGNISAEFVTDGPLKNLNFDLSSELTNVNVASLIGKGPIGLVSADIEASGQLVGKVIVGNADLNVSAMELNGHTIDGLNVSAVAETDKSFTATLDLDSPLAGRMQLDIIGDYSVSAPSLSVKGNMSRLQMASLGVKGKYENYALSTDIDVDLQGNFKEWLNGHAAVSNFKFEGDGPTLQIKKFMVSADDTQWPGKIEINSDFLNGKAQGVFNLAALVHEARDVLSHVFPAIYGTESHLDDHFLAQNHNMFNYEFTLGNAENISRFLNLPIQIIYPINIDGAFDYSAHNLNVSVDAPYLQNGDKIIENTALYIGVDGITESIGIYGTSTFPTQKGVMAVSTNMKGANNRVDTQIDWTIERDKHIDGNLSFSTEIGRDFRNGGYKAEISVNPGDINFGNDVWKLTPATISLQKDLVSVDDFALSTETQAININGKVSKDDDSELTLDLSNIELISIFETLDINNALIGGKATGRFHARELFGNEPRLWCDNLHVQGIGYNYCTLGDGDVRAHYDNERQAFNLDAIITGADGRKSHIYGDIFAAAQSLDLNFDANRVKVGFMQPFMKAFAAAVTGYASGHARLYGTFKDIDLEGNLYADSLGLKLDFTNTWYYATDSIHIRPGIIDIKDVTMRDQLGHTAMLNGYVRHSYFHLPVFEFRLTNADHFLCYDVTSRQSADWYGRVFGNGSAYINGKPGVVNIDVNMATTEGSTFTFVLSDAEEADDYTFITFRDITPVAITDTIIEVDRLPAAVREYRDRQRALQAQTDAPSDYNMNLQVDITPAARIILVMDPVGGDEIKATGSGNLRMTYQSVGNDLHMYGRYTINSGSYNFTLQDIIVKDFTIREGSSITFTGDPYAATLDIKANYSLNANLSDLDESFLQDKDLNRTTVPVNAVLMANGDMRQPDVSFDLEFPTLNSDIYRKVRSIVSTEEMMNRQIIYLLALNRFYTPDYMSTTKGNELFSVASSTIASQLGNMLGKLSENWSVAPNLRSDRGDFSDVEVDVALSSSLLNNRLLFNGNFGYRDKSLNTNQFVGDFDIEYLLDRRGGWRLKAYNRYNDQNYYLRTAQTTQGIGIMFKRDFDNLFNFLKHPSLKNDTINNGDN